MLSALSSLRTFAGIYTGCYPYSQEMDIKLPTSVKDCKSSETYCRFQWLGEYGPCFPMHGDNIKVVNGPIQFYETLKFMTRNAKKRIIFASLYIGTGHLEQELVKCIEEACLRAVNHDKLDFRVNILLDMTRGSRGMFNSRTLLLALLTKFPNKVCVNLFHSPHLRGMLKWLLPERFNEVIGLTHIKVFLVDDSVIISGANLSHDYFTNRQDRYILFNKCKSLTDFFDCLVNTVSDLSLKLHCDNSISVKSLAYHPFKGKKDLFILNARQKIENLLSLQHAGADYTECGHPIKNNDTICDTWVFPLLQMGPFGIDREEQATLQLFRKASRHDEILLASGYFNLTEQYMDAISRHSSAKFHLLSAAPEANGFFNAKGIAGYIPTVYTFIAQQFCNQVKVLGISERIKLYEYMRYGWTFHAKGLWYYLPNELLPSLVFVGSSNFGYRSVYRDLECQVALVTDNAALKEQLREEHVHLYKLSVLLTDKQLKRLYCHIPFWVRAVTGFVRHFF